MNGKDVLPTDSYHDRLRINSDAHLSTYREESKNFKMPTQLQNIPSKFTKDNEIRESVTSSSILKEFGEIKDGEKSRNQLNHKQELRINQKLEMNIVQSKEGTLDIGRSGEGYFSFNNK